MTAPNAASVDLASYVLELCDEADDWAWNNFGHHTGNVPTGLLRAAVAGNRERVRIDW